MFSTVSLEKLKQAINLVEVISPYVELKRSGATYKGLCPFHDEKTPSFTIHASDSHYHCFGCGAHGDSIAFLMNHQKLSFTESVEQLAAKYQISLEKMQNIGDDTSAQKNSLKKALELVSRYYQSMLLHTAEGHAALDYLKSRAIDLPFIHQFGIGYAPKDLSALKALMRSHHISEEILIAAGIVKRSAKGYLRDCYSERITFPIRDSQGSVIGFSARKFVEETFGGKYVNTAETSLFKKSHVLFGFSLARRTIAKERKALIVEGQIDALRLHYEGFAMAIASQGTAFGDEHVRQLVSIGVEEVYLAFDSDEAGQTATVKVGNLFQKEGIGVFVIPLPEGSDPDSYLRSHSALAFEQLIYKKISYIEFLVSYYKARTDHQTPAGKNALVTSLAEQIRQWNKPIMVHESLKVVANLLMVPESMLGIGLDYVPNIHIRKSATAGYHEVDSDKILEADLLRWLLFAGQENLIDIAVAFLPQEELVSQACRNIYSCYLERTEKKLPLDLLSLSICLGEEERQLLERLHEKKINKERALQHFKETVQKILDRNWIRKREEIKMLIQSGTCSDDEVLELSRKFSELKRKEIG